MLCILLVGSADGHGAVDAEAHFVGALMICPKSFRVESYQELRLNFLLL